MGKPTASQRRACKGEISLYPAETSLGWRVIGTTNSGAATEKLANGEWREVYDEYGNFWGYQVLATFKKDEDLVSGATSTSITVSECLLNAGLGGRSRTARLPEEKKIARRDRWGHALPPEDAIERAVAKVAEFGAHRVMAAPYISDAPQGWNAFPEFARIAD
jgi:hypothetical protein